MIRIGAVSKKFAGGGGIVHKSVLPQVAPEVSSIPCNSHVKTVRNHSLQITKAQQQLMSKQWQLLLV